MDDRLKQLLRRVLPTPVAYASFMKALFENEIELRLLPWLCDRRCTSIDVGAFTGTYSIGASIFSRDVIAVEPQNRQANELRRAMPSNVTVVEAALSNVSGDGILMMESVLGGSMSHLYRVPSGPTEAQGWVSLPVPVRRVDELCDERVGFIKIDAEGHELEVLQGAAQTLEKDRPMLLVEAEERHRKGAVGAIALYLESAGYQGYFVCDDEISDMRAFDPVRHQDPGRITGGPRRAYKDYINNFIFVHRQAGLSLPPRVPSAPQAFRRAVSALVAT